jgi:hypothetical protein
VARVRVVVGRLATSSFEEESETSMGELTFAGKPAESRASTRTVPWLAGLRSCKSGAGMTLRRVANPLGVTVVTWAEAAFRPTEDAEMDVVPGVVLAVKFATTNPAPVGIFICDGTEPTPFSDEVRKTTVSLMASEAAFVELCSESTIAG